MKLGCNHLPLLKKKNFRTLMLLLTVNLHLQTYEKSTLEMETFCQNFFYKYVLVKLS